MLARIAISFTLMMALAAPAAAQIVYKGPGTYQSFGNTTYGPGGAQQTIGNQTYTPGTTYSHVGNQTYGSDGTSFNQVGGTTYGSNGTTSQTIGNQTIINGPRGSRACTHVGNQTYCN